MVGSSGISPVRGTEEAEPSLLRGVIRDSKPKDHRLTGGQAGAVSVRQHDHSVDQLAVTSGFDPCQVGEDSTRIGRVIRQCDPVDRPAVHRDRQRRRPCSILVRLRVILPVDPLGPVNSFTLRLGACLEKVVKRFGMRLDDRWRDLDSVLEKALAAPVDLAGWRIRPVRTTPVAQSLAARTGWSHRDRCAAVFAVRDDPASRPD